MSHELTAGLFLVAIGGFAALAGAMNWEWFFRLHKARVLSNLIGRGGARAFYAVVGLVLVGLGIGFMAGLIPLQAK